MTTRIKLCITTALAAAALISTAAQATSMRCGSHIISGEQRHGIGRYEVLKRCGEPTERYGDTWIYDEPGKDRRVLRFGPDGTLSDISTAR